LDTNRFSFPAFLPFREVGVDHGEEITFSNATSTGKEEIFASEKMLKDNALFVGKRFHGVRMPLLPRNEAFNFSKTPSPAPSLSPPFRSSLASWLQVGR